MVKFLVDVFETLVEFVLEVVDTLVKFFVDLFETLVKFLVELFESSVNVVELVAYCTEPLVQQLNQRQDVCKMGVGNAPFPIEFIAKVGDGHEPAIRACRGGSAFCHDHGCITPVRFVKLPVGDGCRSASCVQEVARRNEKLVVRRCFAHGRLRWRTA